MKMTWDKLDLNRQNLYIHKAEYLLERGYITDKNVLELARQIFERSLVDISK